MIETKDVDILLVEDNPDDIELVLRALKKHDLNDSVMVVSDGQDAIDYMFARGRFRDRDPNILPKVILLDLKLPKLNGLEVLKLIKSDPVKKIVPVIVFTSSTEEKDILDSYSHGINSYIVKPVDFDKFLLTVKDIGFYWLQLNKMPRL